MWGIVTGSTEWCSPPSLGIRIHPEELAQQSVWEGVGGRRIGGKTLADAQSENTL